MHRSCANYSGLLLKRVRYASFGLLVGIFLVPLHSIKSQKTPSAQNLPPGYTLTDLPPMSEHELYKEFMTFVAGNEIDAKAESQNGHDAEKTRLHIARYAHITANEELLVKLIAVSTFERARDVGSSGRPSTRQHRVTKEEEALFAANRERKEVIFSEGLASLKQQLGTEDFARLNRYVIENYMPRGRVLNIPAPSESQAKGSQQ